MNRESDSEGSFQLAEAYHLREKVRRVEDLQAELADFAALLPDLKR